MGSFNSQLTPFAYYKVSHEHRDNPPTRKNASGTIVALTQA